MCFTFKHASSRDVMVLFKVSTFNFKEGGGKCYSLKLFVYCGIWIWCICCCIHLIMINMFDLGHLFLIAQTYINLFAGVAWPIWEASGKQWLVAAKSFFLKIHYINNTWDVSIKKIKNCDGKSWSFDLIHFWWSFIE